MKDIKKDIKLAVVLSSIIGVIIFQLIFLAGFTEHELKLSEILILHQKDIVYWLVDLLPFLFPGIVYVFYARFMEYVVKKYREIKRSNSPKEIIDKIIRWNAAIGFGVGIVLMQLFYVLGQLSYSLDVTQIGLLHQNNWGFIFIDLFPILFGLAFFYISSFVFTKRILPELVLDGAKEEREKTFEFINHLSKGDLDAKHVKIKGDEKLEKALIKLRDSMIEDKTSMIQRRKENSERSWISEGLAKFADILRNSNNDLNSLAFSTISNIVKYVGADQCGFFLLNDDNDKEKYFELISCYAYGRRKYNKSRIEWAEGMVGTCALEKEMIYRTEIPEDFVDITSGLGGSKPRCLILLPLVMNDHVFGVIEIASFKVISGHEIEFLSSLAESIAATLSYVKTNIRTAKHLEESRDQTEKLAIQEAKMKQSMEELRAAQEEADQKKTELMSFTRSVNHSMMRVEFSEDGTVLYANTKFLHCMGFEKNSEVEGQHISKFIGNRDKESLSKIWDNIISTGKHFEGDIKFISNNRKDIWLHASLLCLKDDMSQLEKIMLIANDVTHTKELNLDYEGKVNALNSSSVMVEYKTDGSVSSFNTNMLNLLELRPNQAKKKSVFDFIEKKNLDGFKEKWNELLKDTSFKDDMKIITGAKKEKWLQGNYTPVKNGYGEVIKIVYIAYEITEQKNVELEKQKQAEKLKIQDEKLRESQVELARKLEETKTQMKKQFHTTEIVKQLNEKTLEGTLDAVVTINKTGIVEFFNKSAEELWMIDKKEILGEPVTKLIAEDVDGNLGDYIGDFFCVDPKEKLESRKEVYIRNTAKEDVPVLITLAEAEIDKEYRLTAFIQQISVELF